jgi:hypothetical protein
MGETNGRFLKADDTHFNREESGTSDYSAKKIDPPGIPKLICANSARYE